MKKAIAILIICLSFILSACSSTENITSPASFEPTSSSSATSAESVTSTTSIPTPTAVTTIKPTATATITESTASVSETHILTGTFQEAEWGDYLHVSIKGDDNIVHSFFVLKYPGVEVETLLAGQKVKVTWKNSDEYLDPPGETINIDQIINIELLS